MERNSQLNYYIKLKIENQKKNIVLNVNYHL